MSYGRIENWSLIFITSRFAQIFFQLRANACQRPVPVLLTSFYTAKWFE